MKEIIPDPAETEIVDFPEFSHRVQPFPESVHGAGDNLLSPPLEPHDPEVPSGAENVTGWDDNPVDEGHAVPNLKPEGEAGLLTSSD